MTKDNRLISISDILSESWIAFKGDWRKLLEITIRFLLAGLIQLAFALIAERLTPDASLVFIIIGTVIAYIIILQTVIVLIDYLLQKERGEKAVPHWRLGFNLFWPYLWISLLVGLATLGGLILFVLPGIWLSVIFSFAIFVLIDEKKRGAQALARSAELVKGRWWKTLWRLFVPAIVAVLLTLLISFVLTALISLFSGGFEETVNFLAAQELTPLQQGVSATIDSIVSIVILPLALLYHIKLYTSLKHTQHG